MHSKALVVYVVRALLILVAPACHAVRRGHRQHSHLDVRAEVEQALFVGGDGPHHSYRIPSIVSVGGGRQIAFAEGRVRCSGDSGDIDLVFKISDDNGKSWSPLGYLAGTSDIDTWGNPTAVFEKPWNGGPASGRLHVFFNWNRGEFRQFDKHHHGCPQNTEPWRKVQHGDRHTYYIFSDDAGETWSARQNLTDSLLPQDFTFDIVGPGTGIQKNFEPQKGALVVPASSRNFVSSDHGATWNWAHVSSERSGDPSMKYPTSETTIAECTDGKLYRNDRAVGGAFNQHKRRWTLYMDDPGEPVAQAFSPDMTLLDPRNEGSMMSYTSDILIFLNAASTVTRRKMRVQLSIDCGKTWRISRWLYADQAKAYSSGKGGYSSMTKTNDFHIAALSETNDFATDRRSIDFLKFDLDWICEPKSFCRGHACTVEDISSIGDGKAAGEYFHAMASCFQGANAIPGAAQVVQQRRNGALIWTGSMKFWPEDKNGGLIGDCHGRRDPYDRQSVWQTGDVILFHDVQAASAGFTVHEA